MTNLDNISFFIEETKFKYLSLPHWKPTYFYLPKYVTLTVCAPKCLFLSGYLLLSSTDWKRCFLHDMMCVLFEAGAKNA